MRGLSNKKRVKEEKLRKREILLKLCRKHKIPYPKDFQFIENMYKGWYAYVQPNSPYIRFRISYEVLRWDPRDYIQLLIHELAHYKDIQENGNWIRTLTYLRDGKEITSPLLHDSKWKTLALSMGLNNPSPTIERMYPYIF